VGNEPYEHGPGYLVPAAFAHYIPLLDFHHVGILGIYARHPRAQENAVPPVLDSADQQQPADPSQGAGDQVSSRGVRATPGTGVHQVVDATPAMRAFTLE
jgi:hypothetical protein